MFLIRSFLTFRSTTFIYFHFKFPSAGRSFMLEFLLWSFKIHLIRCFPKASVLLVICCSDFVFQERSAFLLTLRVDQFLSLILDHDPICWMLIGIMMDFFKQPRASVQIKAVFIFWTFLVLFDFFGRFCLLLCLCIILTWNPIDYHFSICFW